MPWWKLLVLIGVGSSTAGAVLLAWLAGVPWILPNRFRTKWDIRAWWLTVVLIALGGVLQFVGTYLAQ